MDYEILKTKIKTLYVENEKATREIVTGKLIKKGYNLIVAKNGLEALELFKKNKPDIIITELNLPKLSGVNMIEKIREIDKKCSIIVITNEKKIDLILKSIDLGIDKYLIKDLEKYKILEELEKIQLKHINIQNKLIKDKNDFNKRDLLLEKAIQKKFCSFFKESLGKGPKDVQVIFRDNTLQIKSYDVLTRMEKSLLENLTNKKLIEYNRSLFYKNKRFELENIISNIIKKESVIKNVNINILKNMDSITYKFN